MKIIITFSPTSLTQPLRTTLTAPTSVTQSSANINPN